MISVSHLTKRFGRTVAVDDLSFHVAKGEIVGFLGPNGAGKTTTMRILACFLSATGGSVRVGGFDVLSQSLDVRRCIGYLPERMPLYDDMRVSDYLRYRGRLKGLSGKTMRSRVPEVIDICGLGDVRSRVIGQLSMGYRQRVGLADSLIHEPDLLILDEPTVGLDPNQIMQIRSLIKGLAERHTVLLSSHILSEVEALCGRVLILNHGRIVADDTPSRLIGLRRGKSVIRAEIQGPDEAIVAAARRIPGVLTANAERAGLWTRIECECERGLDLRTDLFKMAASGGWLMRELTMPLGNLEDVFAEITGNHEGGGESAA